MYQKIQWTEHVKAKMRQYGLSKYKLLNLLRKPERKEQGIAEGTMAVMMTNKSFSRNKKPSGETWIMYQDEKGFRKIISAWRYPGISKPGESIPIPQHIKEELLHEQS